MTDINGNERHVYYKREFTILPIQLSSGEFCKCGYYYTKYILDEHWTGAYHATQVSRLTEEEVMIDRLRG